MSVNSLIKSNNMKANWWRFIWLPIWVVIGYFIANFVVVGAFYGLEAINLDLGMINQSIINMVVIAVVYVLALALVVGVPLAMFKSRPSLKILGIATWPTWRDIILSPIAYVVYMLILVSVVSLIMNYAPIIDFEQAQDVLFDNLGQRYEYLLAFVALVVVAPIAEEILFRGYLYGKLRQYGLVWLPAIITSVVFAALHGQWNVAVDTFILSMVMCGLREYTGSIWAGTLVHMIKNGVAYFALFISPSLFGSLL